MSKAIKIRVEKASAEYDYGRSKFFGDPTIPAAWQERFAEDIIFFAQIRLDELAPFDKENRLPHSGYLYFFLDTGAYPYDVWIDYYDGEPDMLVEEFNDIDPEFSNLTQAWLMSFEECDEYDDGMKLFGLPSSDVDGEDAPLLLQYDPLTDHLGFLEHIDGHAYIFHDPKELNSAARLVVDTL